LNISKDSTGKIIYKNFLYRDMTHLMLIEKNILYFISQNDGVALFFKDYVETDAKIFYENLQVLI